jgi:hypothetical protein
VLSVPKRAARRALIAAALGAAAMLGVPAGASALAPADVPGIGADTGRFTLPIKCQITLPWLGNIQVLTLDGTVDIEGIAPVQLRPGQEFYLSQGKGALTLPSWLSTLGGIATINRADANVDNLFIGATNSVPAAVNLSKNYDLKVRNVPVRANRPITVGLPASGTFDVGPFKAPDSGTTQLRFLGATANVVLRSTLGFSIAVRAYCKDAATNGASLLSIAVGGVPGGESIKWQDQPLNYPTPPANQLIGIVNAPYTCQFSNGKSYELGIAVGARIPLSIRKGTTLSFYEASGAVVLPAETVNQMIDDGYDQIAGGTVDKLTLKVQGGTPVEPNVIPAGGLPMPTVPLVRDQRVVFSLPQTGTLGAGPFTPTAGSESIIVGLGSAEARLKLGNDTTETSASCGAPSPDALLVDAAVV